MTTDPQAEILHGADQHKPGPPRPQHIWFKFQRARDRLAAQFRRVFDPFNLTDPQWRVLRALSVAGELDTMTLADRAFLLSPSLSRILRDLLARNLIERCVDATDARRFFYMLTADGHDMVRRVQPRFQPIYDRISEEMPEADIVQLCELLDRMSAILVRDIVLDDAVLEPAEK
ncbi:MarR family transcriptional regulator [Croceicoccus bisphenolivorans]|uniref:MarR family transcriptional regulator n=1 Tax=Croceicoccus bisphenolivorans TaxID=1783232 RepID=UPI00082D0AF9|nr:MarR family transcriptional regulator [Croceicoccus bisphenolivorans]